MSVKHSPRASMKHTPREMINEDRTDEKTSIIIPNSPARLSQIASPGKDREISPVASTNSRMNNGPVQHSPSREQPFGSKRTSIYEQTLER